MKPNTQAIWDLIQTRHNGCIADFARACGLRRSHVSNVLHNNGNVGAGKLFFGGLMRYCTDNGLNFQDYIEIPEKRPVPSEF